jgi:hypothetical protein
MKLWTIAALILMMPIGALAKKEPKPAPVAPTPPVYDLTGFIGVKLTSYDATVSVHTTEGDSFAGCDVSGSTASCSDNAGVALLKLADGHRYITGNIWIIEGPGVKHDGTNFVYNPLLNHLSESWHSATSKATNEQEYNEMLTKAMQMSETFKYRLTTDATITAEVGTSPDDIVMCVPNPTGNEACATVHKLD